MEVEHDLKNMEHTDPEYGGNPSLQFPAPQPFMPVRKPSLAGYIFMSLFGLAFFSVACLFGYLNYQEKQQKNEPVAGTVIEMVKKRGGGKKGNSTL
jgi:hypothetical protein